MKINLEKQNKLWLALGILAFIILLVIIIVPIIKNSSSDGTPKTKIENWNAELPEVPQSTRITAEEYLYSRIEQSLPNDTPTSGAEIRKGSQYSIHKEPSFVAGNFIVDIPKIKQSYVIKYIYGQREGQANVELSASIDILCVTNPNDQIYPDFHCANDNSIKDTTKYLNIYYFRLQLPYTGTLANGEKYVVDAQSTTDEATELSVSVNSCGDEAIMQEAETSAKKWVESLNLDIGKVTYFVPLKYNNCLVK